MYQWLDEVNQNIKKRRQLLFSKDSEFLTDLAELFAARSHRVMVLLALDFAAESVAELERAYPDERRPREALEAARQWAAGEVKMRYAQRKILDCHAVARGLSDPAAIAACHAVGQACAVVHTAGHALGYPMYDLTAIVRRLGADSCREAVERRKAEYIARLFYWDAHAPDYQGTWAEFLS